MTEQEQNELVQSYVTYLEHTRIDEFASTAADDEAWERFHELSRKDARTAWKLILEVLSRCGDDDVALVGAGLLGDFVVLHPEFASELEEAIRSNDRFLKAFQYVAMTGVPLEVQRRMNSAMGARGVDPKFLAEYDEELEDEE